MQLNNLQTIKDSFVSGLSLEDLAYRHGLTYKQAFELVRSLPDFNDLMTARWLNVKPCSVEASAAKKVNRVVKEVPKQTTEMIQIEVPKIYEEDISSSMLQGSVSAEKLESIRKMISKGAPAHSIAAVTDLTLASVLKLGALA